MVLPTSVVIKGYNKKEPIDFFNEDKVYEVVENSIYALNIKISGNDKLYFEGLDQLEFEDEDIFEVDDNKNQYIKKNCVIDLYDQSNTENSYVPGYYKISLLHDDKQYLRWIHVSPKFIDEDNYSEMVNDIERKMVGLSQSVNRGKHGVKITNTVDYDNRKIDILIKNYYDFQVAVYRILKVPRNRISSEYKWINKNDVAMDYVSTIKMASNPQKNKRYLKRHVIDFNTSDNVTLKNSLIRIREIIISIFDSIGTSIHLQHSKILYDYLALIDNLLENSWLTEVKENRNTERKAGSAFSNFSYNFIFELNDKLDSVKNIKNKKHEGFSYFRKSSQNLYEIWGYFKVIDTLINMGFSYNKGFIDDIYKRIDTGEVIKNGLTSGTNVLLTKTENNLSIKVKVIYDDEITNIRNSSYIWTDARHRKPDIRMDFFDKDDVFIGTIVVDTKYRRRETFTKDERKGGSRDQLSSYAQMIMSNDLYKSNKFDPSKVKFLTNFGSNSCVVLLGVMYPGNITGYENGLDEIKKYVSGKRIMERPGTDGRNITKFLEQGISEIINRYNDVVLK